MLYTGSHEYRFYFSTKTKQTSGRSVYAV